MIAACMHVAPPCWRLDQNMLDSLLSKTGSSTAIPSSVLGWSWGQVLRTAQHNPTTVSTNTRPPEPSRAW
jgi:hypothetical protein